MGVFVAMFNSLIDSGRLIQCDVAIQSGIAYGHINHMIHVVFGPCKFTVVPSKTSSDTKVK